MYDIVPWLLPLGHRLHCDIVWCFGCMFRIRIFEWACMIHVLDWEFTLYWAVPMNFSIPNLGTVTQILTFWFSYQGFQVVQFLICQAQALEVLKMPCICNSLILTSLDILLLDLILMLYWKTLELDARGFHDKYLSHIWPC